MKFLLSLLAVATSALSLAQDRPPNFILIFADDLGYGDLSCYGQTNYRTPHLDQMAKEGARFTDFLVASPGCSPSRAAILTGCQPVRIGLPGVLGPNSKIGLNPKEETIAELLKRVGYKTAIFGKWHIGVNNLMPPAHGFDEYYGLPYSNDMWPKNGKTWPPLHYYEGFQKRELVDSLVDQGEITGNLTRRAVDFIDRHKDEPFFLYVPHPMTHVPIAASPRFLGKSGAGLYGDTMMELDWSVGEILKSLKRNGIDDNTLVVFTSDNGPWLPYGNHSGVTGGLREGKGTTFEGGVRVPMIARWPGKIPANRRVDALTTALDVLPTFANLAKAPMPREKIDGFNAWPLWSGETNATPYRAFPYYIWPGNLEGIRIGRWKLHFPHPHRHQQSAPGMDGARAGEVRIDIGLSLFDLGNDLFEQNNVADQHPDIVEKLTVVANGIRQKLGDRKLGIPGSEIRPPGQVIFEDEAGQ